MKDRLEIRTEIQTDPQKHQNFLNIQAIHFREGSKAAEVWILRWVKELSSDKLERRLYAEVIRDLIVEI